MKLVHYEIIKQFDFDCGQVQSLVIENQDFFRKVVSELSDLVSDDNNFVLSHNEVILNKVQYLDVIKDFAPFNINGKALSSKLISYFEKKSNSADYYFDTQMMLGQIEKYINNISLDMPFDVVCSKINTASLLKSIGIEILDDYADPLLMILDYFEITRELSGEKIFILVNMRSYFSDERMQLFINSVLDSGIYVMLIEPVERQLLYGESRCLIDSDLCEI